MLQKFNQDLDDSQSKSFADLPSELMITDDNRGAISANYRFNMATFEASKKLLHDDEESKTIDAEPEKNTLLRRIEIFEGEGQALRLIHEVVCTGFNASAPKLLYSTEKAKNKAVIDKGSGSDGSEEQHVGGPLFLQLLTDSILRSFSVSAVTQLSCGFEHCIALTASGCVVSWGYGASGSLGHGDYVSYTQPKLITAGGLSAHKVSYITCGGYHNAAITSKGSLFMWGRADVGQLGLPESYLKSDDMGKVSTFPK